MNISNLLITNHARQQFINRYNATHPYPCSDPDARIKKLLKSARPAIISNVRAYIYRSMKHPDEDTRYFEGDIWRFVIIYQGNKLILKTCELKNYYANIAIKQTMQIQQACLG